jgi:hypothetical protein
MSEEPISIKSEDITNPQIPSPKKNAWVDPKPEIDPSGNVARALVAIDMNRAAAKLRIFGIIGIVALFLTLAFYIVSIWAGMAMFLFATLCFGYQFYRGYSMEIYYTNKYKIKKCSFLEALQ